jgi:tetratricopeptide (TPR) repeat protein
MKDLQKRLLLYCGAVGVLGSLGAATVLGRSDADVTTLLSSADVQLRLAYAMPARDQQGRELDSRTHLIADAEASLAIVERVQPGMAVTAEFRGFAHMLRGDFAGAAACYAHARSCGDCQDEQRDILVFNQARMLAAAGQRQQAVAVFEKNAAALDARFGHQRAVEQAAILRELGRRLDAEALLETVARDDGAAPLARLQSGIEFELLGHLDKAAAAFAGATGEVPIADYHLARLKLRQGEVDTSLQLLERVAKVMPAEVRRRILQEPDAWQALAAEPRFQELSAPGSATPGR